MEQNHIDIVKYLATYIKENDCYYYNYLLKYTLLKITIINNNLELVKFFMWQYQELNICIGLFPYDYCIKNGADLNLLINFIIYPLYIFHEDDIELLESYINEINKLNLISYNGYLFLQ